MKIVRMKNTYNHTHGVIGPDGRMHAWCADEDEANEDLFRCMNMFDDCEVVELILDDSAPNDFPDACGIYVTEGEA